MASFKTRRLALLQGGFQVGATGASAAQLFFGSACINCPSALGDGRVTGSGTVSGLAIGDKVLVVCAASLPAGMFLYSASGAAGGISASFMNSGSADNSASADVTVQYLAWR